MVRIPGLLLTALSSCAAATLIADSVMTHVRKERQPGDPTVDYWGETRAFVWVALSVFAISVFAQLVFIRMMHPTLADFFGLRRRTEMFLMTTAINLVNGFVAGYLAMRVKNRDRRWRARQREVNGYLNHHVRNALSSIQYAASCTKDQKAIDTCNESIRRIVSALATAEKGIPQNDEFRQFQERLKAC
jgi:hypothetical protein